MTGVLQSMTINSSEWIGKEGEAVWSVLIVLSWSVLIGLKLILVTIGLSLSG